MKSCISLRIWLCFLAIVTVYGRSPSKENMVRCLNKLFNNANIPVEDVFDQMKHQTEDQLINFVVESNGYDLIRVDNSALLSFSEADRRRHVQSFVMTNSMILVREPTTCFGYRRENHFNFKYVDSISTTNKWRPHVINHLLNRLERQEIAVYRIVKTKMLKDIYFEGRQQYLDCGKFAVNHLLGKRATTRKKLDDICHQLQLQEFRLTEEIANYCEEDSTGNYHVDVLRHALFLEDYELTQIDRRRAPEFLISIFSLHDEFLIHSNDHWHVVRRSGKSFFKLNSLNHAAQQFQSADAAFSFLENYLRSGGQVYYLLKLIHAPAGDPPAVIKEHVHVRRWETRTNKKQEALKHAKFSLFSVVSHTASRVWKFLRSLVGL